jgi:glutathione-regulated potassium-efflux system ancillary protein KefF
MHRYPFREFVPVMQQTAQFCGMRWLEPIVVQGAHKISTQELEAFAEGYRARMLRLIHEEAPVHA